MTYLLSFISSPEPIVHSRCEDENLHSDDQDERNTEQDRAGVLQVIPASDVGVEGRGWYREHAGQEITRPSVASRCRGAVWAICGDHVVDGGHVDAVVGDSDNGGEYHGAYPVNGRAAGGPGETDQSDRKAGRSVEKPPETRLVLCRLVVGLILALLDVASDDWDEGEIGDEVSD